MNDTQARNIISNMLTKGFTRENIIKYLAKEYPISKQRATKLTDQVIEHQKHQFTIYE